MDAVTAVFQGIVGKLTLWFILPIVVVGIISMLLFRKIVRFIVMMLMLIGCVYAYVNFGMK